MEFLFGKRLTPEEMLRRNQRSLNKGRSLINQNYTEYKLNICVFLIVILSAIRDLDRERMKMEQQEKKIIADIKKMAKDNQMVISCCI